MSSPMQSRVQEQIQQVMIDVFDNERFVFDPIATVGSTPGWDSLAHVHLILALEKKFKVKFSHQEISNARQAGQILSLIESKMGGRA